MSAAVQTCGEFWPNFLEMAEKVAEYLRSFVSCLFFYMKHKKLEYSQIDTLVWFQNLSHILMKWNQRCAIFTKGPSFLLSGRKIMKRFGSTGHIDK
jgi:hypothetical protein